MKPVSRTAGRGPNLTRLAPVPREVRLTASGKTVAGLAVAFAAAAVAAAIGLSILHLRQEEARQTRLGDGVPAEATVARVATSRGEHPRSLVTYRYAAADGDHEGTARLPERDRRTLARGDRIAIVYLRSRPDQSWVAGDEPGVLPVWLVPLISAALSVVAWLIASSVRRERVLLTEGRVAEARIVSTKKVHGQHHHGYRVDYEFTALSGAKVASTTERRRAPAEVGATVTVVYHRDNPRWNAFYPLSLVTPAQS